MACFVVPAAEAVIVKAIELHQKKKERRERQLQPMPILTWNPTDPSPKLQQMEYLFPEN